MAQSTSVYPIHRHDGQHFQFVQAICRPRFVLVPAIAFQHFETSGNRGRTQFVGYQVFVPATPAHRNFPRSVESRRLLRSHLFLVLALFGPYLSLTFQTVYFESISTKRFGETECKQKEQLMGSGPIKLPQETEKKGVGSFIAT